MNDKEYVIENITKKEWELLEDNNINWFPDDIIQNHNKVDVIICGTTEYERAIKLLNR